MLFMILCRDRPGRLDLRTATRPQHIAYLQTYAARLHAAGGDWPHLLASLIGDNPNLAARLGDAEELLDRPLLALQGPLAAGRAAPPASPRARAPASPDRPPGATH